MPDTVVITGANRGIGLSFVKLYKKFGCKVYALCRTQSSELKTLGVTTIEGIDVGSPDVSEKLKKHFKNIDIQVLINNAGILRSEKLGNLDFQSIEQQFAVNTLGPLRVTEALLENIKPGKDGIGRIALMTSLMGSIGDNASGGYYGYRMSKAALNIAGVSLAHDLRSKNIAVGIFHPGLVSTDMIGGHGDISADEAAERLDKRIYALNMKNTGTFWHSDGEILPW